jgi:hypothetical protein
MLPLLHLHTRKAAVRKWSEEDCAWGPVRASLLSSTATAASACKKGARKVEA